MFAYLKGILVSKTPTTVVIDVNGVGYSLLIPHQLIEQLPSVNEMVKLYTTFVVREFAHTLYGFLNEHERDVFEVLIDITGVGPKLALSLIGHLPLPVLQQAVLMQDVRTLCNVPGVGKKTAERLMVELKDKLANLSQFDMQEYVVANVNAVDTKHHLVQDATLALINLGYTQFVAYKAVKQSLKELNSECDLSQLITVSLKNI